MTPDEKLFIEIDNAFDRHYQSLTPWEKDFFSSMKKLLSNPRSLPSVKQKDMAKALVKKLNSKQEKIPSYRS